MTDHNIQLDQDLISAVKEGRLVLFLGAGASKGAKHPDGKSMPDGQALGELLANKFLAAEYSKYDLKTIYDYSCSARSIREVQKFLYDIFFKFEPTPCHDKLPSFAWRGIATTNYDLLVEKAYAKQSAKKIIPYSRDGAVDLSKITQHEVLYLKLHGCLTCYDDIATPLITSTEQLINFDTGRKNLFKQFLEWGQNYPIAFVGYALNDTNLRALVDQLVKEGDGRPRHFIIRPGIDQFDEKYWRDRRFVPIDATFTKFIESLDTIISNPARRLGAISSSIRQSSITKFISHPTSKESPELLNALTSIFEHVSSDLSAPDGKAGLFYQGVNQSWYPVANNLDAHRHVTKKILSSWILRPDASKQAAFYLLNGHAGSGKSVALRRSAWEAARTYDKFVLFLREGAKIDEEALREIFELTNLPLFLFVDDAGDHYDDIRHLMSRALVKGWPLIVIGAERMNEWTAQDADVDSLADDVLTVGYLSEPEISELVSLLEKNDSLGELAHLSHDNRIKSFKEFAGRQLLVALHEATHGISFEEILENEYKNIPSQEARVLYLDICALHRFGPPVRAGLISRVHGISFDEFEKRFFRPLENVVILNKKGWAADYSYQARHNYIAEIVFGRALKTAREKFDLIIRILTKLNPDYSYDQIVLEHLIRARAVAEILPQRDLGLGIYDAAEVSIGRTVAVLHQRALYEARIASDRAALDRAQALVQEALKLEPTNGALKHSLAEFALKRSEYARSPLEASAERQLAISIAKPLSNNARNSFAHHTVAKATIAELADALEQERSSPSELATEAVNQAIQKAENAVRSGLGRFPNDSFMLTAEAELSKVLRNADRAKAALTRALTNNPKSELIASRLALVLISQNELEEATAVLRQALDQNPGSANLNFQYAKLLLRQNPAMDVEQADALLFYFKRGFREGGNNTESQYWYARQLFLAGQIAESKKRFEKLERYAPPYMRKDNVGLVYMHQNMPRIYYGTVAVVTDSYGLVDNTQPFARIFFRRMGGLFEGGAVKPGDRVAYQLAFNARGPIALNMFHP